MIMTAILLMLGVIEIILVVPLHVYLVLWEMIVFYLISTALGLSLIKLSMSNAILKRNVSKKSKKKIENKLKNKQGLNEQEAKNFEQLLLQMNVTFASILVLLPGFLTDILGVLCVIPGVSDWYIQKAAQQARLIDK